MPDTTAFKQDLVRMVRSPLSLKLLLGAAIVLTADFAWLFSHAEKWDTPSQVPSLFLCELPLLVSLYFLIAGDRQKREIRGAGITFGVALSFCVLSPLFFFILLMTIWDTGDRYPNLVALEHFLPICVVVGLAVAGMAWMRGIGNRAPFAKAAGGGAGCFFATSLLIFVSSVSGSGDSKMKAAFLSPSTAPEKHVAAIAACLIRHQTLHPEAGFPASLQDIRSDWRCDSALSDPAGLHGYWIFYSRLNDGSVPGWKDFRLEAVPTEKGRNYQKVAGIDRRGEPLAFLGLNATAAQRGSHFSLQTVDAGDGLRFLYGVRGNVRGYMETHDPLNSPPSLDGVVDPRLLKNGCDRYEDSEIDPKERVIYEPSDRLCFKIEYFPPSGTPADTFAVSVQCMSYGEDCLRSYFLDYDDSKHATAEPRAATAQDPVLLPCETEQGCHDTVWTSSQQGSEWIFIKASFLDAMHSTSW